MGGIPQSLTPSETLTLATDIVSAFVSNNTVSADKLPSLLQEVHEAVQALASGGSVGAPAGDPAVAISKSVKPEYIVCLEDGKKLKMLKRYLRTHYDLSPEDYRRKWKLPADYPMVAPNYAKRRSEFAKEIGLGRTTAKKRTTKKTSTKRRGRPRKSA
ncbi:MAG: MucR family transcriptional regulator [Parvularculaceae bacterium]|nr:MucR family transcriptional regulator [Parvularculaceae bacterium]